MPAAAADGYPGVEGEVGRRGEVPPGGALGRAAGGLGGRVQKLDEVGGPGSLIKYRMLQWFVQNFLAASRVCITRSMNINRQMR